MFYGGDCKQTERRGEKGAPEGLQTLARTHRTGQEPRCHRWWLAPTWWARLFWDRPSRGTAGCCSALLPPPRCRYYFEQQPGELQWFEGGDLGKSICKAGGPGSTLEMSRARGEPSAPPCPPFHAPRFTAGQRLGCHAGWSWPCVPSSAAPHQTRCGEIPWLPRGEIRRFCMAEIEAGPNSLVF